MDPCTLFYPLKGDNRMPKQETYKNQAEGIIKHLKARGMEGFYCANREEARQLALSIMKTNSSIAWGGSETLKEVGLLDELRGTDQYRVIEREKYITEEQKRELKGIIATSDYFLMSTNAITLDGQLVNIDGAGSRLSYLIYGPETIIVLAGMNKVAGDVEQAVWRVQNIASPPNAVRLNTDTPCRVLGKCGDCNSQNSICCQVVITKRSRIEKRIKVILIGEELGY